VYGPAPTTGVTTTSTAMSNASTSKGTTQTAGITFVPQSRIRSPVSEGKRPEASGLLALIEGWFPEGFDTADLQEARALLDALACGTDQQGCRRVLRGVVGCQRPTTR
jgi:hypothetical protein